jgi:hypothetical protein
VYGTFYVCFYLQEEVAQRKKNGTTSVKAIFTRPEYLKVISSVKLIMEKNNVADPKLFIFSSGSSLPFQYGSKSFFDINQTFHVSSKKWEQL